MQETKVESEQDSAMCASSMIVLPLPESRPHWEEFHERVMALGTVAEGREGAAALLNFMEQMAMSDETLGPGREVTERADHQHLDLLDVGRTHGMNW